MKIFSILIFCVLLCFVNPNRGFTHDEHSSHEETTILNKAYQEYKQKNFQRVLTMIENFVKSPQKKHSFAYILYGLSASELKQYKKAIMAYNKGINFYPKNYTLYNNCGLAYMNDKQYVNAGKMFIKTISYAPKEQKIPLRFLAAQNFYYAKQYAQAAKEAEIVFKANPQKREYIEFIVMCYIENKAWKKADNYLSHLLNLYPLDVKSWKTVAAVRIRQKNYIGTATALEISQRLEKDISKSQALLSLYAQVHAPHFMLETLKKLPNTSQNQKCRLQAQIQTGKLKDVLLFLDKQKNTSAEMYFLQGTLQNRLLNFNGAIKSFQQGALLQGEFAEKCLLSLALAYWEQGEIKLAQKEFTKLLNSSYANEAQSSLYNLELMEKETILMNEITIKNRK